MCYNAGMVKTLTDYTPNGKPAGECSLDELNATAERIRSDGMLRMHAMGRLLDELCEAAGGYEVVRDDSGFTKAFARPVGSLA